MQNQHHVWFLCRKKLHRFSIKALEKITGKWLLTFKKNRTVPAENANETENSSTVNKQIPNILNLKDEKNSCIYRNGRHNINIVQQR